MESFVEDLLNLRLLREGKMTISKEQFDLKDTLDLIVNMFAIKTGYKSISLSYSTHQNLLTPNNDISSNIID